MALLFMDGMDLHANLTDSYLDLKGWVITNASYVTPRSTSGRFGGGHIELNANGTLNYGRVTKDLPGPVATLIAGWASYHERVHADPAEGEAYVATFLDGSGNAQVILRWNTIDQLLRVYNASSNSPNQLLGTASMPKLEGQWLYLEVKVTIDGTNGAVAVRQGGQEVLSVTGVNTDSTGAGTIGKVRFLGINVSSGSYKQLIDDVYFADDAGGVNDDFLGDVRIETLRPNGDTAQAEFTPSSGTDHYAMVDDNGPQHDGDGTYVQSDTVGHVDRYAWPGLSRSPAAIHGINVSTVMRKDDAGPREARALIRSGETTAHGATRALTTSYAMYGDVFDQDPDTGGAWTESALETLEAGVEVVS
jgi:hypothetical protein